MATRKLRFAEHSETWTLHPRRARETANSNCTRAPPSTGVGFANETSVMTVDDFGNCDAGPLEPGERLFIDTGRHREMAMIDYSLTEDRYIISYREAGEVLTTH